MDYSKTELEQMIKSENWKVRMEAAIKINSWDTDLLEKLVDDADPLVRAAVAAQGYGLDRLINDKYAYVREEVAEQGYGLDKLVEDKDCGVRREVAEKAGYLGRADLLEKLINDENPDVRAVAIRQRFLF